jgi:hypothetical protein
MNRAGVYEMHWCPVGIAAVLLLKLLGMIVVPRLGLLAAAFRGAGQLRRSAVA